MNCPKCDSDMVATTSKKCIWIAYECTCGYIANCMVDFDLERKSKEGVEK